MKAALLLHSSAWYAMLACPRGESEPVHSEAGNPRLDSQYCSTFCSLTLSDINQTSKTRIILMLWIKVFGIMIAWGLIHTWSGSKSLLHYSRCLLIGRDQVKGRRSSKKGRLRSIQGPSLIAYKQPTINGPSRHNSSETHLNTFREALKVPSLPLLQALYVGFLSPFMQAWFWRGRHNATYNDWMFWWQSQLTSLSWIQGSIEDWWLSYRQLMHAPIATSVVWGWFRYSSQNIHYAALWINNYLVCDAQLLAFMRSFSQMQ